MQKLIINIDGNSGSENVHIVHFEGAFDGSMKDSLTDLEKLIQTASEKTNVIFDFKKLDYLNSYAIGQLVAWQNHMLKIKGQIIIAALNKNVEDILGILGISNLFKIFPDIDSALAMVKA
jgi:anti-anti-sigma factor